MPAKKYISNLPYALPEIEGMEALVELALDIRWSWNHAADKIWQAIAPKLWAQTHNPRVVLQSASRKKMEEVLADESFKNLLNEVVCARKEDAANDTWFSKNYSSSVLSCIAYFSMEYMLSEALPIYVGGLGNVAGDQLKSASDLGVPVVAVGLLYQQGYFRQEIDKYGNQQAIFPFNDPGQLPVMPVRLPDGQWLNIEINMSGFQLLLRAWQVQAGRVKLYLLDSNHPANLPIHRGITSEIYGGGAELRIKQEILLGIGGWKLLQALNIHPEVCHLNEGHAAFLILERANEYMKAANVSFEEALTVTRAGNLFTTHTAVPAGFDHFYPSLMEQFFADYANKELHIDFQDLMALGRQNAGDFSESFNMAYLAVRGCGAVNGVSQLHGRVSRHLFSPLFPRWAIAEVPVGSVTNGVHTPTWDSELADKLWTTTCGKNRWRDETETLENDIQKLSKETLWNFRNESRKLLVDFVREKFARQVSVSGEPANFDKDIFQHETLTLGFARRFVPYKRPNLLLHDKERLVRLLTNKDCPVQLVIAGKAPPYDESGKALIRQWVEFIEQYNLYHHVIFLSDYDMSLSEHLVQGVDVWLNTPRRPWEACGTSGMKVLVNGGINLSELDGWWAEAYTPEIGWAIGDGLEHSDEAAWDVAEAESLYQLLEQQVVPEFYRRNEKNIPEAWVERMRKSMATLTPQFSANRTVREYAEKYYLPAAAQYKLRAADNGKIGKAILHTKNELNNMWAKIKFGNVAIGQIDGGYQFDVEILLEEGRLENVAVEMFANGINGAAPEHIKMRRASVSEDGKTYLYEAKIFTQRPSDDYTARIIPDCTNINVPLELELIHWQH
ncbi:alpha-glucan phosphorylase [Arachidicoccus ginsenosidimutans]|uniref:alpha-glucan family phosphorylase n=1 Tax=Arachidicoccus sp. BS20 TaxID=1850526 RepID=UPI0007F0F537|nr:alpha-glucan family phosphorylase [Arachidicoccus sp. BS20]ANI89836.1 alpha-glucan phosphorylase [Arachidicoccus sp. BS20]